MPALFKCLNAICQPGNFPIGQMQMLSYKIFRVDNLGGFTTDAERLRRNFLLLTASNSCYFLFAGSCWAAASLGFFL